MGKSLFWYSSVDSVAEGILIPTGSIQPFQMILTNASVTKRGICSVRQAAYGRGSGYVYTCVFMDGLGGIDRPRARCRLDGGGVWMGTEAGLLATCPCSMSRRVETPNPSPHRDGCAKPVEG
jgi:hypothetical protein